MTIDSLHDEVVDFEDSQNGFGGLCKLHQLEIGICDLFD